MTKPIRPKSQKLSDDLMKLRYISLELKEQAIITQNSLFALQDEIMAEPDSKLMAMATGQIEQMLVEVMSQHGKAKHIHALTNELGRKLNEPMPTSPTYSEEYLELAAKKIPIDLSSVARR